MGFDRRHAGRWVHPIIGLWLWVLFVSRVYVYALFPVGNLEAP